MRVSLHPCITYLQVSTYGRYDIYIKKGNICLRF